jgi:hypothetical protein
VTPNVRALLVFFVGMTLVIAGIVGLRFLLR